jgi:hypothetical protein
MSTAPSATVTGTVTNERNNETTTNERTQLLNEEKQKHVEQEQCSRLNSVAAVDHHHGKQSSDDESDEQQQYDAVIDKFGQIHILENHPFNKSQATCWFCYETYVFFIPLSPLTFIL